MENKQNASGRCLCGSVRVNAPNMDRSVATCHCGMCRKWGGGAVLFADCGTDVSWQGEEHIGVYSLSAWAERGFCKVCGTRLFYRAKEVRSYHIPATLFDNAEGLSLDT